MSVRPLGLTTGLRPSPAATWGSPTCACGLTALPDERLAPHLAGHRAQPEELVLGGPPPPDTVVIGERAIRLCEARTNVPQPRTPIPTAATGGALGQGREVLLQPHWHPSSATSVSVFKSPLWISLPHSPSVAQTSAIHFCTSPSSLPPSTLFSGVMAFLCSGSSIPRPHCTSSALGSSACPQLLPLISQFPSERPCWGACTGQWHFPHPT